MEALVVGVVVVMLKELVRVGLEWDVDQYTTVGLNGRLLKRYIRVNIQQLDSRRGCGNHG